MLAEFKAFLLRGNVVDLAVAVVIGAAFGLVVSAFVADIITPIIAATFGKPSFAGLTFEINDSVFRYGEFLNAVISFITVAAAIFFLVLLFSGTAADMLAHLYLNLGSPGPGSPGI